LFYNDDRIPSSAFSVLSLKAFECGNSPGKVEVPAGVSARSKGVILLGVTLLALIDLSDALPSESSLPLGGVTN
jgi:hypothetical protein